MGAQNGHHVSLAVTKPWITFKTAYCNGQIVFDWKPRTGTGNPNKFVDHNNDFGGQTPSGQSNKYCAPAYSPCQISRIVLPNVCDDPDVTEKTIAMLIRKRNLQPTTVHDTLPICSS